jgi:hypothetical protein
MTKTPTPLTKPMSVHHGGGNNGGMVGNGSIGVGMLPLTNGSGSSFATYSNNGAALAVVVTPSPSLHHRSSINGGAHHTSNYHHHNGKLSGSINEPIY